MWHCLQGPQQNHESRRAEAQLRPHCLMRKTFACWICCRSRYVGFVFVQVIIMIIISRCVHIVQLIAIIVSCRWWRKPWVFRMPPRIIYHLFRKIIHCKPTPAKNVCPCCRRCCPMFQTFKNHSLFPLAAKPVLEGLVHTNVNRLTQRCASARDMLNLNTQILDFGHDRCHHLASVWVQK